MVRYGGTVRWYLLMFGHSEVVYLKKFQKYVLDAREGRMLMDPLRVSKRQLGVST